MAHERKSSLRDVIEDALRAAFARGQKTPGSKSRRPLKTFKGTGIQPGIDLSSSSTLLDAMESR